MLPKISSSGVLLDTHIWIDLQSGSAALSQEARRAIDVAARSRSVYLCVISVWELAMLAHKDRIQFDRPVRQWVETALSQPGIQVLFMTPEIAMEAALLTKPMHNDPADRMIIASAMVDNLTLITRDRPMLTFAKSAGILLVEG